MGFLARRKVLWHGRPTKLGRLAYLTDDKILDRFDRILKSLSHYSEQLRFRSRRSRLPRLSLESEPLCVGRLSTQSNSRAPIKEKVFARAGLIIWCRTYFITTIHHQSHSTSHFKLIDSSGPLERHSSFRGRWAGSGRTLTAGMGSDPTRSTPPRIRIFGLDRQ